LFKISIFEKSITYFMNTTIEGRNPWEHKSYIYPFWIVMIVLVILVLSLPNFLIYIQTRTHGVKLDDPVLRHLPSYDCSLYIFTTMYSLVGIVIYYSWSNSWSFFRFATAYIIMNLLRMSCILIFPLEAPDNLVPLHDPFINFMYKSEDVVRDLFFSGHTSTVFLIYLVFRYSGVKWLALLIVISIAIMLLIQHVHYTIDVLGAFPFTYLSYRLSYLIFKDPIDRKWFELKHDKDTEKLLSH
jgi:membrane-associated phospholipid phosphatase